MLKFTRWVLPVLFLVWFSPAFAQSNVLLNFQTPTGPTQASAANPLPVTASVAVGAFAPGGAYANLTATGSSARIALPTGTVVAAFNTGTTAVSCALGSSSVVATANENIIQPGSWFAFTVGSNADLACIDQGGADTTSNVVVLSGGSGLPAGSGSGSTSGSGGAVYGPTAAASPAANPPVLMGGTVDGTATGNVDNWKVVSGLGYVSAVIPSGGDTTEGTTSPTITCATTWTVNGCLAQIDADIKASLPAGSAVVGKFGVDQTTPGTTNGVALVGVNGATALAGTGAVGPGSPRVAVGTDTATIAGSAPSINLNTINGANFYQAEPASTTITALTGGSGGAAGDYLSHCTVIPTTTSPGVFTITDGSTAIYSFPGGASSLSNLVPWTIPVGAKSSSGAWKVTTGAGLSIVCVGKFT